MDPPCRLAPHFSTSTATTSGREVAGRRSPHWSGFSPRSASPPPPSVPPSPAWSVRAGCYRVRAGEGAGYQLSIKAVQRLDEAAARIYRTRRAGWDGKFDLVVLTLPQQRSVRARITSTLSYLGYGSLDPSIWVAPRPADQVDLLLKESGIPYERFSASHTAGTSGAAALVGQAWDLDALDMAYREFVAETALVAGRRRQR